MDVPYALKAFSRNWSNPYWWPIVFNTEIVGRFHSLTRGSAGISIPDEDWDTLFILDGCRYDLFEAVYESGINLEGILEKKISKGSGSPEFLRQNFQGSYFNDIIYVTANPFVKRELDDPFFHTEHVWLDGWDHDEATVLPSTMIERTRALLHEFPNKRYILHFMQPHHPFVGETKIEDDSGFVGAIAKSTGDKVPDVEYVWEKLRRGKLTKDTVWEAYEDNLRFVLEEIQPFVGELEGKSVLTSDHGNAFGERARPFPTRVYGHGDRIRIPALVEVPWFVPEYDTRRETTKGTPEQGPEKNSEDADIEQRLAALGYRT
jgi:hypothetical protein